MTLILSGSPNLESFSHSLLWLSHQPCLYCFMDNSWWCCAHHCYRYIATLCRSWNLVVVFSEAIAVKSHLLSLPSGPPLLTISLIADLPPAKSSRTCVTGIVLEQAGPVSVGELESHVVELFHTLSFYTGSYLQDVHCYHSIISHCSFAFSSGSLFVLLLESTQFLPFLKKPFRSHICPQHFPKMIFTSLLVYSLIHGWRLHCPTQETGFMRGVRCSYTGGH